MMLKSPMLITGWRMSATYQQLIICQFSGSQNNLFSSFYVDMSMYSKPKISTKKYHNVKK